MGTLIAKNKAVGSILSDLADCATSSTAQGGKIAELAGAEVVPVKQMVDGLDADLVAAKKVASGLSATVDVAWQKSCHTVRFVYDLTWNQVGRPAFDPKLSLLFPSGASHYTEGAAAELPERMELLAQLFEKAPHPKLSENQIQESTTRLRASATEHSEALDLARIPVAKVVLLERTRTAMAQTAHSALANFKRLMKIAGFTEAQIHEIVPSHPRQAGKKGASRKGEAAVSGEAAVAGVVPVAAVPAGMVAVVPAGVMPVAAVAAAPAPAAESATAS